MRPECRFPLSNHGVGLNLGPQEKVREQSCEGCLPRCKLCKTYFPVQGNNVDVCCVCSVCSMCVLCVFHVCCVCCMLCVCVCCMYVLCVVKGCWERVVKGVKGGQSAWVTQVYGVFHRPVRLSVSFGSFVTSHPVSVLSSACAWTPKLQLPQASGLWLSQYPESVLRA